MGFDLYAEFDEIFRMNDAMFEYAERNIKRLQKQVSENTLVRRYGVNSMYGGYFCSSLILETTTGGFRKGRLLHNAPKGRSSHVLYELDKNGQLLRLQEFSANEILNERYVIRDGSSCYCMAMSGKKRCTYIASTLTIYQDDKVEQFDIIEGNSLWSERYEYGKDRIRCRQYYYVPRLKGSDRSIPVGEKGSPAQLFVMNFTVDENSKIDWLEHGEYINGKVEMDFEYRK